MTIRNSEYFSYANRKSTDFNIYNVNVSGGMLEEPLTASRRINEIAIRGRDRPYFQDLAKDPLTLTLSFGFYRPWDSKEIRRATQWLCGQTYYQPLIFSGNTERIYYALAIDSPVLVHTGFSTGYVNITFRMNGPYSYSPYYQTKKYTIASSQTIEIYNPGDLPTKPQVLFKILGGDPSYNPRIAVYNRTNADQGFDFDDLDIAQTEEIYMHGENQFIRSSLDNTYRYNQMSGDFLELLPGYNRIDVFGNVEIQFKFQCILEQG